MDECLACKSCSSQCPVGVDVPDFRARFLGIYHQRYARPLKDYLVGNIEKMAPIMAKFPRFVNFFLKQSVMNSAIKGTVGYVDTPLLSEPTLEKRLADDDARHFDLNRLKGMAAEQRAKTVVVVQDPFTSYYDASVVADLVALIRKVGYEPLLMPFMPNGKPQHVKGFLSEFAATAKNAADLLNQIAELDVPMVGVDPSLVLVYRDEYTKALGASRGRFTVHLVHEWLQQADIPKLEVSPDKEYALFGHCSEKTALPASQKQWQQIFEHFGMMLTPVSVGCCGMAGTYGHEADHLENSIGIYKLSWEQAIAKFPQEKILATGYSCRSQVARLDGFKPKHPLQALLAAL